MPQAISALTSSHEGKKRRGYEAALSPRSSPPIGPPMSAPERLPPIRSLLAEIPSPGERALSQLHAPGRENPTGPRCALPARLSPPSASRRIRIQPNGETSKGVSGSPRHKENRSPIRSHYDEPSNYQLPIHAGPPASRTSHTASHRGPLPASPYAPHQTDTRRDYANGETHSVAPPTPYHQNHSHAPPPPYPPSRDYRDGNPNHGATYYGGARNRDHRAGDHRNGDHRNGGPSTHQVPYPQYQQAQYDYPAPPHTPTNSNYAIHHQYQNGYHHGSVQFEADEPGGQAPRRRRGNLPRDTTDILKQWFHDHLGHPYPTEDEKQYLCRQTGLQMTQISNWFINARRRRGPELVNQATAETLLREQSGDSNGSSD